MTRLLAPYAPFLFAVLRIIAGLMFATHGAQKLFGILGGPQGVPLASLFGVAGIVELVCGLLIAAGLFASPAAFIASGEMAVAYFKQHAPGGFWPVVNRGELAVLYCFLYLYIAAHGAGVWSLDSIFKHTRPERTGVTAA